MSDSSNNDNIEITNQSSSSSIIQKSISSPKIILPNYDDNLDMNMYLNMVKKIFGNLEENQENKKIILMDKLPNKYKEVVMKNFEKSLEDVLDLVIKFVDEEHVTITFLHVKFNPEKHEPKSYVDQKIKIAKKKKYTDKETVASITECLPISFRWFTNLD